MEYQELRVKKRNMFENIPLLDARNTHPDVALTPADYLGWAAREKNLEIPTVPANCVFAFDPELLAAFRESFDVTQQADWPATHSQLFVAKSDSAEIGIVLGTVGAPFAAMTMEELIVCGGRSFISAGAAGILQSHIQAPAIILATSAIRDEGTSYHYVAPSVDIDLNLLLVSKIEAEFTRRGSRPHVGKVWTTDALYRETQPRLKAFREAGVLAVEMEIAALAAVARFRSVEYVGIAYALDNLSKTKAHFPDASRKQLTDKFMLVAVISDYFRT